MFQVGERKRNRRTLEVEKPSSRRRLDVESITENGPLRGAVVCLTGLPADEKTRLHRHVEKLGGSYTRDLDTSKTTHLIAKDAEGAKYDTAVACPTIRVVSPAWLEECIQTGKRANERLHSLTHEVEKFPPLEQEMDLLLQTNNRNELFAPCRFLLLGFDDETDVYRKLGTLIRRAKGTIYWELNEMITHLIVADECDEFHREASRTVSLYHPSGPVSISPSWITSSWRDNTLLSAALFPPRKTLVKVAPKKKAASKSSNARQSSCLFRGSVFALLRLSPSSGCVDYDTKELENCITSNGGQILSTELLEALRMDKSSNDSQLRNCYVVCWGGYTPAHMMVHPLLSQVDKEKLCNVVLVTPVWLHSCSADRKLIKPSKCELLFQPQSWSMHRLPESKRSKSEQDCIKVSVTGFVGSERTGIIQVLRVLGAHYTENLQNTNTHLICKESKGPKYKKATKWGLHVVSAEWMYHVMEYGYGGKDGNVDEGCEDRFSLMPTNIDEEDASKEWLQKSTRDEGTFNGGLSLDSEFQQVAKGRPNDGTTPEE